MRKGNFFGNGNSDIVLQNNDGSVGLWDMKGTSIVGSGIVANSGPTWHIEDTAGGTAITPGSGSFTDTVGNVFTLSAGGITEENGSPIPEGFGTEKLEYYNGKVYGEDAATGNWFTLDSDGSFSGAAAPGFFGDGNTGIVLQNDDGSVGLWDVKGTTIVGSGIVANSGSTWHVKGTGVFFSDGNTGIVLQNDNGSVGLWDVKGTTIVGSGIVANPGPTWHIKDTGDFFGHGNTDIVLQNDDGSVGLWDMSGTTIVSSGIVANSGPTWHVEGTGVFFSDGNTDIVLQNDDGSVGLWDMKGTTIVGSGIVANSGPTWHVKGTGVFFGDGNTDIVLQNDDGSVGLWDMKGTTIVDSGIVANPGRAWNVFDNSMRFIYSLSANETLAATPTTPDEFVFTSFAAGSHTIGGFNPVQDMIEFSKAQFTSFTDVQAAISANSGGAMINLGNGSSLLLPGVDAGSLHASNFVLA
jgi:hypothetical protein